MYNSTKWYFKLQLIKLMNQCDITIDDIKIAIKEVKREYNERT